ncbi:hypothetical protein G0U57_012263 [Chelydra serpentina]|uniref:Uncharacterized protein n=1 Tax=Chelydra serpentina TaxID=8475 RepID=A0A8T1T5X3_CHESE|nr:hypothetical protein G0U57_012263 [Chelydra serpentina]
MSIAVRWFKQHATKLEGQVTVTKKELKESKQATQPWNAPTPLAGWQAAQRQPVQEENKTLEIAARNLQKIQVPSPVINIDGKQQASGSYPVPEEWGQKWKKVALVKLKEETGSTALQPLPYDKSQVLVQPKPRPRLVPVRTEQVSAQMEKVVDNIFIELVNQMKEKMEQFTEHIRRQELRLDRRGVNKKEFQSKKTKLSRLTCKIDALTHGVAQKQLVVAKKGHSSHPFGMHTKTTDTGGTNSGFSRASNYPHSPLRTRIKTRGAVPNCAGSQLL